MTVPAAGSTTHDGGEAERLRLLLTIEQECRGLADPDRVMEVVARLLGSHLDASRCAYADVEPDQDEFTIRHDYTKDCASTVGRYHLSAFGARATALLREGRTLVIRSVDGELAPDDGGDTFRAIGIQAIICAGLVTEHGLIAMMAVHQVAPRDWTQEEIDLVEAIVSRCWSTIQRVRKRIELEAKERFLDATLDAVSSRIAVLNGDGVILRANDAWKAFGRCNGGVWGRMVEGADYVGLCAELVDEPGTRPLADEIRAVLDGHGDSQSFDYSYPCRGRRCWFRCSLRRFETDGHTRVAVSHEDITAIKRAQQSAELAHRRFEKLFDQAPDAVLMTRTDGTITLANRRCEELFGYRTEELVGQPIEMLVPDGIREQHVELRDRYAGNPVPRAMGAQAGSVRARRKDASEVPVEISLSPLEDDEELAVVAAVRNVSDRLARERQERRAQRLASIGTLAGGVAHDLNNALVPVIMGCELIRLGRLDRNRLLDDIQSGAERAADMVRQLLTFARGIDGPREAVDPGDVVREVERIMRGTFPKSLRIQVLIEDALPALQANATQLHQVLLNLCLNARDAMDEDGLLQVVAKRARVVPATGDAGTGPSGDHVVIEVSDTGHGLAPEHVERIFDPFFTTKGPDEGTGLGLSTAAGIVRSHGGSIRVADRPGGGTVFSVWLPADAVPDRELTTAQSHESRPPAGARFLLVDDDDQVRRVVVAGLRALDYAVLTADDGAAALELLRDQAESIDVVVTDLNMPVMDGLGFVRRLRGEGFTTPVIAASGRVDPAARAELSKLGVHEILTKPYSSTRLLAALVNVIGTKEP